MTSAFNTNSTLKQSIPESKCARTDQVGLHVERDLAAALEAAQLELERRVLHDHRVCTHCTSTSMWPELVLVE